MEPRVCLLIAKNRARLQKLIESNAPYKKILAQSQKLDKYISIQMQYINRS